MERKQEPLDPKRTPHKGKDLGSSFTGGVRRKFLLDGTF